MNEDFSQDRTAQVAAEHDPVKKDRRGWYWPFLIAGFLVCTATFDLIVMAIATSHPSIAIEEDYYEKGQRWFEDQAVLQRSAELGWSVTATSGRFERSRSPVEVEFRIVDREGNAIDLDGAVVAAFHLARPRDVMRTDTQSRGDGIHVVSLPLVRAGGHQVRLEGTRGEDRFVWTARIWVQR